MVTLPFNQYGRVGTDANPEGHSPEWVSSFEGIANPKGYPNGEVSAPSPFYWTETKAESFR